MRAILGDVVFAVGVAVVLTTAGLAGCHRAPPPPALRVAIAQAPEALDPRFTTSATAVRLSQLVAPPLCVVGDDGRAVPVLAESIVAIDDLTVEAKLRPGLRFHTDGSGRTGETPLTVDDVVFSFASVLDERTASPHRSRLEVLDAVTPQPVPSSSVDGGRVRFHLKRPSAPFIVDVVCAVGILSQTHCRDVAGCRFHPVGAGAYAVAAAANGVDRFSFTRTPGGAHNDLDVRVMKDGTARLLAIVAGDVDVVAGDVAPWDLERLPETLRVNRAPGLGFSYLGLNARRLDDDTRRAILLAVDVDALVQGRLRGAGVRASGLLPPGHWAKDPSLLPPARDVYEARRLLGAGPREPGERRRVTLLVTPDRLRRSVALALRDQLAVVGVDVDVVVRDWSVVYAELKAGRFDLVLAKWTPVAEPDLLTTVFHSQSIPTPTTPGGNRGGFVDRDVDAWLDQARGSADEAIRAEIYSRVEKRVLARAALVPLWFDDEIVLTGPRVTGFDPAARRVARTGSLLPLQDIVVVDTVVDTVVDAVVDDASSPRGAP